MNQAQDDERQSGGGALVAVEGPMAGPRPTWRYRERDGGCLVVTLA